MTSLKNS